jgi:hypothetical protein
MDTMIIFDEGENPGDVHIPNPCSGPGGVALTLCGWVDVPNEIGDHTESPVNCCGCIDLFRTIRAMKVPNGYIQKPKRKQRKKSADSDTKEGGFMEYDIR